jgi:tetratricopeptide (TPR) repeat protein
VNEPKTAAPEAPALSAARAAFSRGDVAETERLCRALLEWAPPPAGAFMLLAETALLRGRPDAAGICAAKAVELSPDDALAHIVRAKVFFHRGELVEALAAAHQAGPLVGADPVAADALAAILGLLGRHAEALEFSRRAVAAEPSAPQYLFNLAATERMLGRLEDAETHCDDAIAEAPRYALAHYIRADLRTQTPERNHVAQMEVLLQSDDADWRDQTLLRYALAKECEDLSEDARAFDHVAAGAGLWRANVRYDAHAELASIDRLLASEPPRAKGECIEAAPIFVCGLPRTGTTLIERIVASHSEAASIGETGLVAIEARAHGADPAAIGERYVKAVEGVFAPRQSRFVDKTLQNYLYCGLIHAAMPRAKIVLVERDPFDTAWALYKAHFNGGFLFSYDLVELADYWRAYRRLVQHWRATLPPEALLVVAYEDVVADLEVESRRITDFLGLPWRQEVLRFHESTAPSATASAVQVRRPIYASSVGRWRRHAERLRPFTERLAQFGVHAEAPREDAERDLS